MKTGITSIFGPFIKCLARQKRKLAALQLTGRLEDYLVKEFIYQVYAQSKGSRFALTNVGKKGERKIDIAILRGALDDPTITGLVEAKYLRNWHRAWPSLATDETSESLKSLSEQVSQYSAKTHGNFKVKLRSSANDIYGLVFASYVYDSKDDEHKEAFYRSQLSNRYAMKFRYHDLKKPYFNKVYDDVCIKILGSSKYVSLRAGLWKIVKK